jgi:hypothetical protein
MTIQRLLVLSLLIVVARATSSEEKNSKESDANGAVRSQHGASLDSKFIHTGVHGMTDADLKAHNITAKGYAKDHSEERESSG